MGGVRRSRMPGVVGEFRVPAWAGVYLFRDGAERVTYVGKSSHLGRRVAQHFDASEAWAVGARTVEFRQVPGARSSDDPRVCRLEEELIRFHRPPGNVEFNRGGYDPVWERGVLAAHRASAGVAEPEWSELGAVVDLVRWRVVRWVGWWGRVAGVAVGLQVLVRLVGLVPHPMGG